MLENIRKVIQYREMLIVLVQKELKSRYKGSALGFFWNILNPLLMMLVYTVVFSFVAGRGGLKHYPIYLLCGLIPWTWHANAISMGTISITLNGPLINKIYFPTEILPLVMVCANFIHFLFGMGLFLVFITFFGFSFHIGFLWIPILWVIQALLISGIVLILAPLQVFYRDVQNILSVGIQVWFFMTPIIYPISLIPPKYQPWLSLNPMSEIVQQYQNIIYNSGTISFVNISILLGFSFLIFLLGYFLFNHWRSRLPEEV